MAEAQQSGRLVVIQVLRALAALAVAYEHLRGFAASIARNQHVSFAPPDAPGSRVALFFVVSGCVMVISSRRLYGQPHARRQFWARRLVRILPFYWLATLFMVSILWLLHQPLDPNALVHSLLFVPRLEADTGQLALPVLWPGWTLFYELLFYCVFGLMLHLKRDRAVLAAGVALCLLSVAGLYVSPAHTTVYALTRPIVLLFVPGMVMGWLFACGIHLPAWVRAAAALGCVIAHLYWTAPPDASRYGFVYTVSAGLPAALLGVALLGGPLRVPRPALWNRLGDLSFSIYLFHVPVAWIGIGLFRGRVNDLGPWGYLALTLIGTYVVGYCHFRYVERPLTNWLKRFVPETAGRDIATGKPVPR